MKQVYFSGQYWVTFKICVPDDMDEDDFEALAQYMYDNEDEADPEIMSYHEV